MQVSLRRSLSVCRTPLLAAALVFCSLGGSFLDAARGQAPVATPSATPAATAAAAPAGGMPAIPATTGKEMDAGVKLDGATPIDLTGLKAGGQRALNQVKQQIIQPMQGQTVATAQDLDNIDVYVLYKLAEMTWPGGTPEARRNLFKSRDPLKIPNLVAAVHDRINELLLVNLPRIIDDPGYSLAVRHNAMILLGQLDLLEFDSTRSQLAVPLAKAERPLLDYAKRADLAEPLRVAAFMGLARHADAKIPTNSPHRQEIADLALATLAAPAPPAGLSLNSFHWVRKLSLQMVMGLNENGSEAKNSRLVDAVVGILKNDKLPLFLRRDAALTLGQYDSTTIASGKEKPVDVLKALTSLTLTVMKAGAPRDNADAPVDLTKPEDVLQTPTEETRIQFANAVAYYMNCLAGALGGRSETRGILGAFRGDKAATDQVNFIVKTHIDPIVNTMSRTTVKLDDAMRMLADSHGKLSTWATTNNLIAAPAENAEPVAARP